MTRLALIIAAIAALVLSVVIGMQPAFAGGSPCVDDAGNPATGLACLNDVHQNIDSSEIDPETDFVCPDGDELLVPDGQVMWHLILNGLNPPIAADDDDFPLTINAWFDDDGVVTDEGDAQGNGSTHSFYVFTTGDDTLLDAWVDLPDGTSYNNLVLSHVCFGEAESTPTPTPEGSQGGGTGTPAGSLTDTATSLGGFGGPVATVVFGLILLGSLGALAYANVAAVRRRS